MSLSFVTSAVLAAGSPKANPDKARRVAQALTYFKEVWYFTACFIALLAIGHWIGVACVIYRERAGGNVAHGRQRKISLVRLPRAVTDSIRALAFRWTIPLGTRYQVNVMDVLTSAAYATVIFVWSLMKSTSFTSVKFDPRYWANTAANIAASQLPLVAALGMKNNIISFLTGISFDKLCYLHRMTARSVCALIWLHAGGRLKIGLHSENSLEKAHIRCAIMAATALSMLAISFVRPVRERNYEIFLFSHFFLVLIAILGIYFHARNFEPDLGRLVWPVFVVWGLDRALRLLRIVLFNYGYFLPKRSDPFKGTIDVVSPNLIRLRLHRPSFLHWKAGQCVYLTLPEVSKFPLEAHPFTISTIDAPRPAMGQNEKHRTNSKLDKELIFLLRVRDGITGRLANAANYPVTVLMDGPYGSPPSLRGADTALLIAGGSGISFTLPLLLDLLRRARNKNIYCRRVIFVWAVREVDDTNWIADVLAPALQSSPMSLEVDVQIYVTNAIAELDEVDSDNDVKDNEKVSNVSVDQALLCIPGVTVQYLRPDISNIVLNAVHEASDSLTVNVCGAPGLTAVTQRVLRTPRFMDVIRGEATVSLHVEAFGNC